jgi:Leucine-rich repeat (LRR) protein
MFYKYFNEPGLYELNSLQEIHDIKNPEKVQYLDLSYNIIINLEKNIFNNLKHLERLLLANIGITELDENIFNNLTQLVELNLSNNKLTNLNKDIFKNNTQLQILDLSNNNITNLDKDIIKNNTQLQKLDLNNNEITNLDEDIFSNLTQLQELDLSINELTNLDNDIFKNNTQLQELDLSRNKIKTIPSSILLCRKINLFQYYNNEIDYIPPNIQNFLDRLIQQSYNLQFYNDSQNVHNHKIQECIKTSLENILNIPKTINKEKLINDVITSEVMNKMSIQLLLEYCKDKSIHIILNINFEDALLHVLEYINLECSEHKEEIYKILADEIVDSEYKCFTGRISRLINCLNGFTPLVEVKIPENMELSNIIVMVKNNYNGNSVDELKELARKELLERGYEEELINEYVEYIEI